MKKKQKAETLITCASEFLFLEFDVEESNVLQGISEI